MASILPGRRTAISLPSERPKGAGQPCLVIISGAEMGRRIDLTHEEVSIGRSDQCTVCVNSDMVSRRHAVINRILGHYIVVDLKSTNGTFVNDQRIERAELKDGDLLRTGKTVLKYLENNLELEYMQHILSSGHGRFADRAVQQAPLRRSVRQRGGSRRSKPAAAVLDRARHRPFQEDQRQLRASRGRRGAEARRGRRQESDPAERHPVPRRRRGARAGVAADAARPGDAGRRVDPRRGR